ncbi:hypothetical protein BGL52_02030 [Lacticaseibacillus casei]|uniref:Uncharacterized protein n=1 Tax=Lacticaseibacillus casei TaxID=1582 RepID=A0AAN1C6D5_LACCA|nr:hypothetical protein BGL52_02030 [Lacticaseibacillus casei]
MNKAHHFDLANISTDELKTDRRVLADFLRVKTECSHIKISQVGCMFYENRRVWGNSLDAFFLV